MSEEAFLSNQDLIEKKNASGETIKVSAESGHVVEWAEEENYKFRLSAFQDDLRHWLKDGKFFFKINIRNINKMHNNYWNLHWFQKRQYNRQCFTKYYLSG